MTHVKRSSHGRSANMLSTRSHDSIIQLQKMIGNQAVQRLLRREVDGLKADPGIVSGRHFGYDSLHVPRPGGQITIKGEVGELKSNRVSQSSDAGVTKEDTGIPPPAAAPWRPVPFPQGP